MSKIIKLTYLEDISGGDTKFIKEMLELYLSTTATEVLKLNELFEKKDIIAIGQLAHKLKAPIQMLGITDLFNTVKGIEESCKTGLNLEFLHKNIQTAINLTDESAQEVKSVIANF
jgi:HPt (histidine-containing phosphotransfer) domain-containing protein